MRGGGFGGVDYFGNWTGFSNCYATFSGIDLLYSLIGQRDARPDGILGSRSSVSVCVYFGNADEIISMKNCDHCGEDKSVTRGK